MSRGEARDGRATGGTISFKTAAWSFSLLMMLVLFLFGAEWVLRTENFPVRQVRFEGEFKHVTREQLESAVIEPVRGNFFLMDLDAVKARVESLPWVYRASVRRYWPQDVYIRFTEQKLVARWGESAWLNHTGEVVRVDGDDLPQGLPLLEGPDGTAPQVLAQYRSMNRILASAGLSLKRFALTSWRSWRLELDNFVGNEEWHMDVPNTELRMQIGRPQVARRASARDGVSHNGIVLVLDLRQPERKLERFAHIYARTLAKQARRIKQVDLRYTNGFSVEWVNRRTAVGIRREG